jgi:hypothetical protein
MMMRLLLCLLQILFLTWVSSMEHYWVTLAERRGAHMRVCNKALYMTWVENILHASMSSIGLSQPSGFRSATPTTSP